MSPTPWGLGLFLPAAPIVFMADRWSTWRQNPIEATARCVGHPRPPVFNFTDVYERSMSPAARGGPIRRKRWSAVRADARRSKAREAVLTASERVVGQLGGALERTLSALRAVFAAIADRDGTAMRSRASGTARPRSTRIS